MTTISIGNFPIVIFFRPEHVRYILTENPRNFTNREVAESLRQLIGDGLITLDGEAHRQQRRMLQPAFQKKQVESYANVMVQYGAEMLERWHEGEKVDMAQEMQAPSLSPHGTHVSSQKRMHSGK